MSSRAYRPGGTASRVSLLSFSLILALLLVLSTSFAVGIAYGLHQLSVAAEKRDAVPRYLVVLVLDGGEPDYLRIGNLPNLEALSRAGIVYDQAFDGILETETPAGHATLATGSTPARDGLLGFNWITDQNDTVHLFDPDIVRQGGIEHVMQAAGAPTIASTFKARYPGARVVAVSGHKYYAADPLGGPNADYILYYAPDAQNHYVPTAIPGHVPPESILTQRDLSWSTTTLPPGGEDTLAVKLALASFKKMRQQVTLINLPEFDWPLGHVYGGEPTYTRKLMQGFDKDLGMIEDAYRAAGVLDQTEFVVTADHGMSPLTYQIPDSVLDDAVTAAATTSPETTYSTAGYVWLQDPTKSQVVASNIVKKNDDHIQAVYYKVPTKSGTGFVRAGGQPISPGVDAANQYLLQSFAGGNAPDVVAFCTENAGFVKKGAETWKGNHGGGSWGSQHIPLIIEGPGIVEGVVSHAPARLEDVAPTALAPFKVNTSGMQGIALADALANPTDAQKRAQLAANKSLGPIVSALAVQSKAETAAR